MKYRIVHFSCHLTFGKAYMVLHSMICLGWETLNTYVDTISSPALILVSHFQRNKKLSRKPALTFIYIKPGRQNSWYPLEEKETSASIFHDFPETSLYFIYGFTFLLPCSLVQICSAELKIHLDRWTEFCGKGLAWCHVGLLLLPLRPVAGYSERQWAQQDFVVMVTGQAETQKRRFV